jgi:hypothetical protein
VGSDEIKCVEHLFQVVLAGTTFGGSSLVIMLKLLQGAQSGPGGSGGGMILVVKGTGSAKNSVIKIRSSWLEVTQVVGHLPGKHKALSSNTTIAPKWQYGGGAAFMQHFPFFSCNILKIIHIQKKDLL